MSRNLERYLTENRIFNQLPTHELTHVIERASYQKMHVRKYLFHQGDVWPNTVLITAGCLRWVMLSAGGKEHQLFSFNPGEIFWAHSFFDDEPMPASLIAGKKTEVYIWSRDTLLPILYRNPEVMFEITRLQTGIMRRAREIIYGLAFQPVAGRLANFIISSLVDPDNPTLERDMTLEDIAAICATSPEVVCRLLYQFQSDGLVKITRTRITIHDQDALRHLAETD